MANRFITDYFIQSQNEYGVTLIKIIYLILKPRGGYND